MNPDGLLKLSMIQLCASPLYQYNRRKHTKMFKRKETKKRRY